MERGICWNKEGSPEIIDFRTKDGSGVGSFTSNLMDLIPNTQYYVRAYATNEVGTSYGEEKTFTTEEEKPEEPEDPEEPEEPEDPEEPQCPIVTTSEVSEITSTSAVCGGGISDDGGAAVIDRGVCWNTSGNPTVVDFCTKEGSGVGNFTSNLMDLIPNTQYYVRAYATNEAGTSYGEEKTFRTEKEEPQCPIVITSEVSEITPTTAVCGGGISDGGGAAIIERGVCWNTSGNPTVIDFCTKDGTGLGSYTSYLTGLEPNTTYYVRAYAVNANGVAGYGEEVSFTTEDPYLGHEYVDLGLPSGLKWATCNVGASSPEEYGDYFAWGEITTKYTYTESNSLTYGLSYSQLQSQGIIDENNNLTPSYDAATANWGGSWRMPTSVEIQELVDKCTCQWTTQNGKSGYKITGPNGNNIFLPAAGCRFGSSLSGAGEGGDYWSSSPYESGSGSAYSLFFNSGSRIVDWGRRHDGRSVRPVSE